jgi:hypothetical protein
MGKVVFTLSGRMDEEHIAELEALIKSEAKGRRIALDLKNLTLVGFLEYRGLVLPLGSS